MRTFAAVWNEQLRRTCVSKNRIDLAPGASPVQSAPYRAGPEVHKFQRSEIGRMLKQKVIATATTEWASPIFLLRRKTAPSASA